MKYFKKFASVAGVIVLALLVAVIVTWFSATKDEQATIKETLAGSFIEENLSSQLTEIDWDNLSQEVIAWVKVPSTNIDEPIVQASIDAPNAYLYIDALGQGNYGTPYIDCDCSLDSEFVVIYGHHMSDGSVFADFANYSDKTYALEHQTIYLYRRDAAEPLELTVIAADIVNANTETIQTTFTAEEERCAKLSQQINQSDIKLTDYNPDTQLYTFITCSYQTPNSRTVVFAQKK
jgi:sortase B